MDTPKYVQLGEGIYADPADDTIMVINPVEVLKTQNIEVTQESVFAVYADALKGADEEGISLILITEEGIPSTADLIAASVHNDAYDEAELSNADEAEGESTEDIEPTDDDPLHKVLEDSMDIIEETDTTVMITSDEYTGPERRRMPRK